jgi:hypothetical protein
VTSDERRTVARALLGSWPSQVPNWGREALAAYIEVLEAKGLTAESVLLAIRHWPTGDFPPSVPSMARAARHAAFREYGVHGRVDVLPADSRPPDREPVRATIRAELGIGENAERHQITTSQGENLT